MYIYVCIQSIYTVCNIMAKLVFQELVWGSVGREGFLEESESEGGRTRE